MADKIKHSITTLVLYIAVKQNTPEPGLEIYKTQKALHVMCKAFEALFQQKN
ncbi:hypothetical protein [Pontibacter pamirensis]|uniref:hypothetical protein n=1 Tax=Pontibacter pamirensis TaxID=2562824 RepID=UPI001389C362|nr:hypothetical protein [Pontibacter pamirensis]